MKRFLNLELKIDQRKLHSDQTGRFRGLVFNECHRRPGGNPQNAHRSGSRQRQYRCRADNDRQRPELKLPETTKRTVQQMLFHCEISIYKPPQCGVNECSTDFCFVHKKARAAGYSFHLSEKRSSSKGIGSVFVFSKN